VNEELELSLKEAIVVYIRHWPVRIKESLGRLAIMVCHRAKIRLRELLNTKQEHKPLNGDVG
jgi:hypothetical protein